MKKVSLIVNIILAVAVVILYVLHFNKNEGKNNANINQPSEQVVNSSTGELKIAFVNIDTLISNYNYFLNLRDELQRKIQQLDAEFNIQSRTYDAQVADYQDKVKKYLITTKQAQEVEKQLMIQQQELLNKRDEMRRQIAEDENVMNNKVYYKIIDYINDYNKSNNYQYIFSNTGSGPILFGNSALNITNSILAGINQQYDLEQNK